VIAAGPRQNRRGFDFDARAVLDASDMRPIYLHSLRQKFPITTARPLREFRKAGPRDRYAVAFAAPLRNASKSASIVSASVVGMPCGKPL
jgi:hypothetical protein